MMKLAFMIFAMLFGMGALAAVSPAPVIPPVTAASKNYVDSGLVKKANSEDLAEVAFSGSYNDLTDKPANSGGNFAALYEVRSNQLMNATTGMSFEVSMDGFVWRATKMTTAGYWSLRVVNQTGAAVAYIIKGHHNYAAAVAQAGKTGIMPNNGEVNPDNEDGDIGYDNSTIFSVDFFDAVNMHLYRATMPVLAASAILVVEKLH